MKDGYSYQEMAMYKDGKIVYTKEDIQHYLSVRQCRNPLQGMRNLIETVKSYLSNQSTS